MGFSALAALRQRLLLGQRLMMRSDGTRRILIIGNTSTATVAIRTRRALLLPRFISPETTCTSNIFGNFHSTNAAAAIHRYFSTEVLVNESSSSNISDDVEGGENGANNNATTEQQQQIVQQTVEEQYSRKTPLEHVLLRPGMYVGPNERLPPATCWVLDPLPAPPSAELRNSGGAAASAMLLLLSSQSKEQQQPPLRMVKQEYGLVPALVKVFDEILVNASDNHLRHPKSCTRIDVVIDPGCRGGNGKNSNSKREPLIRVWNDGTGIPIHMHATEQMYVPEMLFGHLLTGSNFDDTEKRLTGGRHGYGAKLANIFSKTFSVETLDAKRGLHYKQTWTDNMTVAGAPVITKVAKQDKRNGGGDYTCVEFVPDLARLTTGGGGGNDENDNNTANGSSSTQQLVIAPEDYAVMCRRVVDVAGCAAGQLQAVTLNGRDVSVASFADYCQLYRGADAPPVCFVKLNPRWTVGVGLSEAGSLETVSFVNGMATSRGGTHVNVLVQQITKRIQEHIEKTDAELGKLVSPALIRRHLFVCCDTRIENPSFDSQMKEYLTSSPGNFGSSCTLSTAFLNKIVKSEEDDGPGIVEEMLRVARGRQQASLMKDVGGKKTRRQLLSIPKLEDAHKAGTASGYDCTLILTEGDSAKTLAVAGLEVIGRDRFGVFPLRGKLLNVRDAPVSQLAKNEEVKALCSIIGLDFDKEYDTVKERRELRYGRVMLMTDQDTDGSHIKGLVINFFRCFWPDLLQPPVDQPLEKSLHDPPFLASFVTPLLKVTKKGKKNESFAFYSMAEYNTWRSELEPADLKAWTVKYYKGLGTSTPAEAKEYFAAFVNNLRPFLWKSDADGECLDMVFDKKRAADRRDWILDEYDVESTIVVDPAEGNVVSYEDFVNKEMIHFSNADNIRSIPSVVDGLKPSQRKVLYACFKRKLKSEIKVAQLTGYCAEHTAYHHGEASLQSTIVGMAQDFVGSNNINLLVPSGQFGTRLTGGDDAASPRYIFTYLAPIARYLFPEADDVLLNYREDDGQLIEPEFYCPIIPLLLVNGSQGIGTGWSTVIPPYNPVDVLNYIRAKLDNEPKPPPIRPFARGFSGTIELKPSGDGFLTIGRATKHDSKTVLIDELPLRCWTNTYKSHLLKMREKGIISNFLENHTTTKVSFTVTLKAPQLSRMARTGLETAFKLQTTLSTSNMHAFDANHIMRKYDTPEDIADDFFPVRMKLYEDRKSVLESEMNYIALLSRNKAKFIQTVTAGEIDLMSGRKSKQETAAKLEELGFAKSSKLKAIRNDNDPYRRNKLLASMEDEIGEGGDTEDGNDGSGEFDYLLNMPLSSLTKERIAALQQEASKKESELSLIQSTTASDLWRHDLEMLASHL